MITRFNIAVCAVLALTACDMEGAPQSNAAPPPQRDILPTQQTATGQLSDSTSRTTTTVQGNTTRTETTTSSVTVDPGGFLSALTGGPQSASTANSAADYAGTWNVTSPNNRQCRMTLRMPANSTAPSTVQNQGCFQELFGISRWSVRGSELVLTDNFGKQLASLRATGRNRLEGADIQMWR